MCFLTLCLNSFLTITLTQPHSTLKTNRSWPCDRCRCCGSGRQFSSFIRLLRAILWPLSFVPRHVTQNIFYSHPDERKQAYYRSYKYPYDIFLSRKCTVGPGAHADNIRLIGTGQINVTFASHVRGNPPIVHLMSNSPCSVTVGRL